MRAPRTALRIMYQGHGRTAGFCRGRRSGPTAAEQGDPTYEYSLEAAYATRANTCRRITPRSHECGFARLRNQGYAGCARSPLASSAHGRRRAAGLRRGLCNQFRNAAEQGYALAQYSLGVMYEKAEARRRTQCRSAGGFAWPLGRGVLGSAQPRSHVRAEAKGVCRRDFAEALKIGSAE